MSGIEQDNQTLNEYRERLATLSDKQLLAVGIPASEMTNPKIQGKVDQNYVWQLQ